jgi:hypothetical protein
MANAAPSIPTAIASLQTYSTALAAFTAAWRALESDAAGLEATLSARLAGYSKLDLLCSDMDGAGLRADLVEHRDELKEPARALDPGPPGGARPWAPGPFGGSGVLPRAT